MIYYIDPLSVVVLNNRALKAEKINGNVFGGFCRCGGIMLQKAWVDESILISECEQCWRTEAFTFNGRRFLNRTEVRAIYRHNFEKFLEEVLSPSELEAVVNKAKGLQYSYNAYSRAKKKLGDMNIDINDVLSVLR